jgi:succinate dehydrogenase / fumarate reductase cytochrome b subunit
MGIIRSIWRWFWATRLGRYLADFGLNMHTGQWSHGVHRLTGLIIAFYLMVHIFVNSLPMLGLDEFYNRMLGASAVNRVMAFLEFLLCVAVAYHLLNGVRIILADFCALTRLHKRLLWGVGAMMVAALFYLLYYSFLDKIFPPAVVG